MHLMEIVYWVKVVGNVKIHKSSLDVWPCKPYINGDKRKKRKSIKLFFGNNGLTVHQIEIMYWVKVVGNKKVHWCSLNAWPCIPYINGDRRKINSKNINVDFLTNIPSQTVDSSAKHYWIKVVENFESFKNALVRFEISLTV